MMTPEKKKKVRIVSEIIGVFVVIILIILGIIYTFESRAASKNGQTLSIKDFIIDFGSLKTNLNITPNPSGGAFPLPDQLPAPSEQSTSTSSGTAPVSSSGNTNTTSTSGGSVPVI